MQVLSANSGFRMIPAPLAAHTESSRSRIGRWLAPLVEALCETRLIQAEREIARNRYLLAVPSSEDAASPTSTRAR